MLKQRVFTAAALLTGLLAALFFLPAVAWLLLVSAVAGLGAWEWARLSRFPQPYDWVYAGVGACLLFLLGGAGLFSIDEHFAMRLLAVLLFGVSAAFWILLVPLWLLRGWQLQSPYHSMVAGWVVLLPAGLALVLLRELNPWLLLGAMALVWIADIGAYFAGRAFGRRKLAPSISPGKTWEGVFGAVLGVVGVGVLLVLLWLGDARPPLMAVAAFLVLLTAVSVEGDLFESMLKRQRGVKDSGTLLPGHGGILDRIDSLTSTLPMTSLVVIWLGYFS